MMLPPAVIVHGLPHAQSAVALGLPVTLLSAPGAGVYAGVGWWRALVTAVDNPPDILDCGGAAGRVLESLRAGQRRIVVQVGDAIFAELSILAAQQGATLLRVAPASLDLGRPGALRHLAAWLDQPGAPPDAAVCPVAAAGLAEPVQRPDETTISRHAGSWLSQVARTGTVCPAARRRIATDPDFTRKAYGMTTTGIHIAAMFETTAAAHAARDALVAAGVDAGSILVLDRGNPATATKRGIWATVKHTLIPDDHAHPYAEGVSRGHPLVIADVTEAQRDAAEMALKAAHPFNIEHCAQVWEDAGWDGVHAGEQAWENSDDRAAAGSEGITASGLMSGDYGAVGAPHDGKLSLDITRGRFRYPDAPIDGELVNDDPKVRVFKAG